MDSILETVKKLLGVPGETEYFDPDIIICINTAFSSLTQIGVGPAKGFSIVDASTKWDAIIPEDSNLEMVKTYVCLKARLLFDPPQNSVLLDVLNRQLAETEWRISVEVDPGTRGED